VHSNGPAAGLVAHVTLDDSGRPPADGREVAPTSPPGLVGSAPLWLRACQDVQRIFQSGEWLAVTGEPGVGKMALLRAVLRHEQPAQRLVVFDAADSAADPRWLVPVRRSLLERADSVVIGNVDLLTGRRLRALSSAIRHASSAERGRPPWVAVTLAPTTENKDLVALLQLFPCTVEVPPLRLHLEDLEPLVSFFLARLGHGGRVACSPEAMRQLMRSSWPGNVEQVQQLVHQVVQHRRAGLIQPGDLPPETQTVSRRLLSPLESMVRDAIVKSLDDAHGNKVKAARSLGMSRATIYRKVHEYGIILQPPSSGP
jgi:transcriptional regulator with GAF, ATPase, and Fis domain